VDHKKITKKIGESHLKEPCSMQALHQKVDVSQQGASSSGKPTLESGSSSQHGAAEK
jgi:hypothetical protein